MFDNRNPYTLRVETVGGLAQYFVSFTDGQGVRRETRVSRPVYIEFLRFVRIERKMLNWDKRHKEKSELIEETLHKRALYQPKGVETILAE